MFNINKDIKYIKYLTSSFSPKVNILKCQNFPRSHHNLVPYFLFSVRVETGMNLAGCTHSMSFAEITCHRRSPTTVMSEEVSQAPPTSPWPGKSGEQVTGECPVNYLSAYIKA